MSSGEQSEGTHRPIRAICASIVFFQMMSGRYCNKQTGIMHNVSNHSFKVENTAHMDSGGAL